MVGLDLSQPLDWAFDQYNELSYGSLTAIDYVNVSGKDIGANKLDDVSSDPLNYWIDVSGWNFISDMLINQEISWNGGTKDLVPKNDFINMSVELSLEYIPPTNSDFTLKFKNGEMDPKVYIELIEKLEGNQYLAAEIADSVIAVGLAVNNATYDIDIMVNTENMFSCSITVNFPETNIDGHKVGSCVIFNFEIDITQAPKFPEFGITQEDLKTLINTVSYLAFAILVVLGFYTLITELAFGATATAVITALGAILLSLIPNYQR